MDAQQLMQIRVTGVLVEDDEILIVKQTLDSGRKWSLPGGRVNKGETLHQALVREMREETGLIVDISKLLYVCDYPWPDPSVLHITFLLSKVAGEIELPSNEFDDNPIYDVKMVPIRNLTEYGFTSVFQALVANGFPDAGNYKGLKSAIGL